MLKRKALKKRLKKFGAAAATMASLWLIQPSVFADATPTNPTVEQKSPTQNGTPAQSQPQTQNSTQNPNNTSEKKSETKETFFAKCRRFLVEMGLWKYLVGSIVILVIGLILFAIITDAF